MLIGTGVGPTFATTAYYSRWIAVQSTTVTASGGANSAAYHVINENWGGAANEEWGIIVTLIDPGTSAYTRLYWHGQAERADGADNLVIGSGVRQSADIVTGFRFDLNSGNFDGGTFKMWRRANA